MCGIVGMIGEKKAAEVLINGLERLEYRGYDSAGVYLCDVDEQEDFLIKSKGRIKDLKSKMGDQVQGSIGIGHTRWATHGEASEKNAHPHLSNHQQFVLVHNGVIENFCELQQTYLSDVPLVSETDTEVVVQLLEVVQEQENLTTEVAFRKVLQMIQGSYAFALIDRKQTDRIYVAKNKSPLLIGICEKGRVICSDALAVIDQTKEFMEIHDGEMVTVFADHLVIEKNGVVVERESFQANIDTMDLEKGLYEHYMLKEMDEQPAVIRRLISTYLMKESELVMPIGLLEELKESDRIYIIGCGTSWHAGWASKPLLEAWTQIPVEVHLASEFAYQMPLLSKNPFFIFLTQSGETADSRQVLVEVNRRAFPSLTITNVAGSTLSREASYTLLLHAGPEIAVASTKAYTAQITMLAIMAERLAEKKGLAVPLDLTHELEIVANAMEHLIAEKNVFAALTEKHLSVARNTFYIGRGLDYAVAMEAALKLKEISYIQAEGFAAGELKHGTIALIEEGTPVIGIITEPITGSHTRGNLKEVESRGADTVVIAMENIAQPDDDVILPVVHPLLTPLVSVIPTQFIAYFAAQQRGYDVDKPRNLAKSVTVE